jgi:hypothetical protein
MQLILTVCARMEESAALRSHQPFVAVADVPVGIQRGHVNRDLPGSVCAIDQHRHAGFVAGVKHACQRQYQRAAGGDVIQHREPCARGDRGG